MTCQPAHQAFDPAALDFSMFSRDDLANIALQRSEVLEGVPEAGQMIRAWEAGNHAPLEAVADEMGVTIAERAARIIRAEFDSLTDTLDQIAPKSLADIGCGYAIFDLFAYRRYGCSLLLIDIEETEHRHFGFESEGAAYTSLKTAQRFLAANGVPGEKLSSWNPDRGDLPETTQVDLAVSFLSCGFHYPVDMYMPFFRFAVRPGGSVLLDLRVGKAPESQQQLRTLGKVTRVSQAAGVKRILLRKRQKK